jgi:hypothetical protein
MCIDELKKRIAEHPEVRHIMIGTYRHCLRSSAQVDPIIIRSTAKVLGDIDGYEAVPELIDVLVLTRIEAYQEQSPGYRAGGGLAYGERTVRRQYTIENQEALTALRKFTGVNYGFNQAAWQEWYRQTQRSPSFNLRRN